MRQQRFPFNRIMVMWTSLMLLTGIGAALGNFFFVEMPEVIFSLVQGIAAGSMLTMIAETMLPEAYFKGGSVIGFSTLLGFLVAIFSVLTTARDRKWQKVC
jgi:zinc transporter ZupT